MYKAFGVHYTETQETSQPPTATEVMQYAKDFTKKMLTIKQPEELLVIRSTTIHRYNHGHPSSILDRPVFQKKPTIERSSVGHYIMPPTSKLK
jgi:hypothetical protein